MSFSKESQIRLCALKTYFWESSFSHFQSQRRRNPCSLSFFDAGRFTFKGSTSPNFWSGSGWQSNEWPIAEIPLFDWFAALPSFIETWTERNVEVGIVGLSTNNGVNDAGALFLLGSERAGIDVKSGKDESSRIDFPGKENYSIFYEDRFK